MRRRSAHAPFVVTELGTVLVKHAQGGELLIRRVGPEGYEGIEVLSLDKGPGMSNVSRSLEDGYSTAGSPGTWVGRCPPRTAGDLMFTHSRAREPPLWRE